MYLHVTLWIEITSKKPNFNFETLFLVLGTFKTPSKVGAAPREIIGEFSYSLTTFYNLDSNLDKR